MPRKMQIMGKFPSGSGGDGLSAYEIAKKNGFEGTEAEWLESLKGDPGVYVGSEEPDSDATIWIDHNGENVNLVVAPATAKVGQTIVVKAVDENSKPTEWEAADLPSGGGGSEGWDILLNVTTETDVASVSTTVPPEGHSFDEYTEVVALMFTRPNSGEYKSNIKMSLNGTNPWDGQFGFPNTGISSTAEVGQLSMLHVRKCSFGWIPVLWARSYNGGSINAVLIPQSQFGTTSVIRATYANGEIPEDMTTIMPNYPISAVAIGGYQQVLGAGSKIIVYGKRNG